MKDEMKFLKLFEDGKRFTEELLKENERLRLLVGKVKGEKRELEGKYVKVDVPQLQEKVRLLEDDVRGLRQENQELREQFTAVEEENRQFAERYVEVERQNSDLINMYVASYRLHSTLAYDEVLTIVKEIVINMIGAENFGIYMADERDGELFLIAHEGMEGRDGERHRIGEGVIGHAAATGDIFVASAEALGAGGSDPVACIPLKVGDRMLGLVAINELLIQKDGFRQLDLELFELLGKHAATAIYGATMFTKSERKRSTLEGFVDLLREDLKAKARV